MTTPDQPTGRPVPDTDDLRLLAEIINNGPIGLPQAAWNARMSQAEAAARFVTMAERGMPLRLVAEGDRQMLWRIAQAGPATGGVPAVAAAPEVPPVAGPAPDAPIPAPPLAPAPPVAPVPQMPPPVPAPLTIESQPVQQIPVGQPPMPPAPMPPAPMDLPPASAVPPHEQAIAGAVPLGQPPFGTPPVVDPAPEQAPVAPDGSTWGVPGSSAWVRSDDPTPTEQPAPEPPAADMTQTYPPPAPFGGEEGDVPQPQPTSGSPVVTPLPPLSPPPVLADFSPSEPGVDPLSRHSSTAEDPAPAPVEQPSPPPASSPTRRVMISGQPTQNMTGLFGEHLSISLQQIIDPADQILSQAGYRMDPAERALLVQTTVGNQGPIDYESLPDLYLVLVSSDGSILQKAAMAVANFPAHRVGVPSGAQASGWTVYLVPAATEVAEVRWSVRPDLVNRTVSWGFGPA